MLAIQLPVLVSFRRDRPILTAQGSHFGCRQEGVGMEVAIFVLLVAHDSISTVDSSEIPFAWMFNKTGSYIVSLKQEAKIETIDHVICLIM
jgi:hypothetical protein